MKIHTWDTVRVIAGKNKGKEGTILSVERKTERVTVSGVNVVKKHIKAQGTVPGQIVELEKPIHVSNVMIVDPTTKKPSRIGYIFEGAKKFRIAKKSQKKLTK